MFSRNDMNEGIVLAEQALTEPLSWNEVQFMMAVKNVRVGGMPGNNLRQEIVGRCLGDRSDGKCFFVQIDMPWLIPANWDWKRVARKRINTYLHPLCTCRVEQETVYPCELHIKLSKKWDAIDRTVIEATAVAVQSEHFTQQHPGPVLEWKVLHWDFPWVRWDKPGNRIVCQLCNAFEEPFPQNGSYQNLFIRKHSFCGWIGNIGKWIGSRAELFDVVSRKINAVRQSNVGAEVEMLRMLELCGQSGDLPERMTEDEALQWLRKQLDSQKAISNP